VRAHVCVYVYVRVLFLGCVIAANCARIARADPDRVCVEECAAVGTSISAEHLEGNQLRETSSRLRATVQRRCRAEAGPFRALRRGIGVTRSLSGDDAPDEPNETHQRKQKAERRKRGREKREQSEKDRQRKRE